MKRAAYLLFYLALAGVVAFLAWRERDALRALTPGSAALLIPFAALSLTQTFLSGQANKLAFAGYMDGNTLLNNVRLSLVGGLGNLFPVSLGLVSKGMFAKRSHGLPYAAFTLLTGWQVGAVVLLSGVTCMILWLAVPVPGLWPLAVLLALAAGAGTLDLYPLLPGRFRSVLAREVYGDLRRHGLRQYPAQLGVQVLIYLLGGIKLWLAFRALGAEPGLEEVFFIYTAVNLARYVSFTPGGLGLPEGVGGAISHRFGVAFSLSFLAIALERVLDLALMVLLVPFLIRPGSGRSRGG